MQTYMQCVLATHHHPDRGEAEKDKMNRKHSFRWKSYNATKQKQQTQLNNAKFVAPHAGVNWRQPIAIIDSGMVQWHGIYTL